MGEAIEDSASASDSDLGPLVGKVSVFQFISEATLKAEHRGFREAAEMIANIFFPLLVAYSPNAEDRFVTYQRGLAGVAVLLDLGISPRRNDRLNRALAERIIHFPLVVDAVAVERGDRPVHLVEQAVDLIRVVTADLGEYLRFNLLRVGIHRHVQLPPGAAFAFAMLTHLPFAFAEDLQAGAVDHHVDRTFASNVVPAALLNCID